MTDRPLTDAERARRYRTRVNRRLCVVPLEVSEADIDYLVRSGVLDPLKGGDRSKIAEAVKRQLEKIRHACHERGGK